MGKCSRQETSLSPENHRTPGSLDGGLQGVQDLSVKSQLLEHPLSMSYLPAAPIEHLISPMAKVRFPDGNKREFIKKH
jgi:hypothetical protein